ncbi:hypothetical protein E4U17_003996 [Claviceps sp. LM77 group G4]|nr:hypothetical protein E4U17_003996 [Claviceps sp. LM77 group G4]KAG6074079.1 hypothetical protein E4U16_004238 [Claviceps sp. LM84 group G4]KAG6082940.1 hypothetical protein E4U33_005221 [Claviceps sp. LM78 group G4]
MADRQQPSTHGRRNSLTKLVHKICNPLSSFSEPGTSSAASQQEFGIHVEDDVLVSSQSRSEDGHLGYDVNVQHQERSKTEIPVSLPQYVVGALRRRQDSRDSAEADAAADRPGTLPGARDPVPPLTNDYCARFFPLECSEETWNFLLETFPEDKAALLVLGRKS